MTRIRRALLAALLLLCLLRAAQTVQAAAALGVPGLVGGDFVAYETAGRLIDQGNVRRLYDLDVQQQVEMKVEAEGGVPADQYFRLAFDNPPPIALLLAPLALLPPALGLALWILFNIGCTLLAAWLLLRRTPLPGRLFLAALPLALLVFWPDFLGFFYGQMMGLVLLLYALAACWLRSRRDAFAGLALALLAAVKPQYAIVLLLVVLMQWRRRVLLVTALAGGALALLSLAMVGVGGVTAYLGEIAALDPYAGNGAYLIDPGAMINWRAFLLHVLPNLTATTGFLLTNVLAAGTIIAALVVWRRAERLGYDPFGWPLLVATAATLLATYHSHIHGAMLLLVPYFLLSPASSPAFRGLVAAVFWPPVIALALLGPATLALRPEISLYFMLWLVAAMLVGWRQTVAALPVAGRAGAVGHPSLATPGGMERR